jgi:hypothetical protein
MVDIVLSDDEALNLARHLVQAARVAKELTIMPRRKPSIKKGNHLVTDVSTAHEKIGSSGEEL